MPLKKIDSITVWKKNGIDRYGKETYADPVSLDCRFDSRLRQKSDKEGDEGIGESKIYHDQDPTDLEVGDRVLDKALGDIVSGDFDNSFLVKSTKVDRNGSGTKFLYTATVKKSSN